LFIDILQQPSAVNNNSIDSSTEAISKIKLDALQCLGLMTYGLKIFDQNFENSIENQKINQELSVNILEQDQSLPAENIVLSNDEIMQN